MNDIYLVRSARCCVHRQVLSWIGIDRKDSSCNWLLFPQGNFLHTTPCLTLLGLLWNGHFLMLNHNKFDTWTWQRFLMVSCSTDTIRHTLQAPVNALLPVASWPRTGLSSFISDARQRTREGAKISARLKELSQLSTGAPKSAPKRAPKRRAKAAGAKAGPSRAATAQAAKNVQRSPRSQISFALFACWADLEAVWMNYRLLMLLTW